MNKIISLLCCFLISFSYLYAKTDVRNAKNLPKKLLPQQQKKRQRLVKILLQSISTNQKIELSSDKGFTLFAGNKSIKIKSPLDISYNKNKHESLINGVSYVDEVILKAENGITHFQNKRYQGSFIIKPEKEALLIINEVDLEDYICAVLKTESWPGWPLEINKVLAITCRTYALNALADADKRQRPYHLTNTNLFQTYGGMHDSAVLRQAVNETQGMVIHYNNKPILAMYDSCCGGIVPSRIADFEFGKAPYLKRKYACRYCRCCKLFKWQSTLSLKDFQKILPKQLKKVRSLVIAKRDAAGLVKELKIKGKGLNTVISGQKMYSFKEVKSFCYTTYKRGDTILLYGRGFGHHIGLCQWGAYEMVKRGYKYQKILSFYYPGATIGLMS